VATSNKPTPKEKGVSIINKNLPSFGSDKQLEASIGKQVRMARKNAGVTLQQLSKQSLLSASMLSKIENGQISASLKTIQLICHALNISITSLFKQHDKDVEPTFIKSGNGLTFPEFQHKGVEFIYMLKGQMDYFYGNKVYHFKKGDSLYFDSDTPHGPKKIISDECQFLTIISSNASD